jgi:ribose 5-phosphate isomerase B
MRIAFANDHAAVNMRQAVLEHLHKQGHEILDFGTATEESVDYPDMARQAGEAVQRGKVDLGIVMCGSGVGISISANKLRGIRCALCTDEYAAKMSRAHNDANMLALRGREIDVERNLAIVDTFLAQPFEGGRHQRRVDKIADIENLSGRE